MKPAERFSKRVDDYVRARPGYPGEVVTTLVERYGLTPSWSIADVGTGTGISAALFLRHGCTVFGVEPNQAMRAAAIDGFGTNARFHAVDGTAEATTLVAHSVDAVVAAQAFHWFDRRRFREECMRILKPGGIVVLLWNVRRVDDGAFGAGYEALLREFGTDYLTVRHENVSDEELTSFFGGPFERDLFDNLQVLDLAGLKSRLLSSSYAPAVGHPRHDAMLAVLDALFAAHQKGGRVTMEYELRMYTSRL